jgi:peptidoglycan/LPS O-acetylase OafA/YrhL
MHRIHNSTRLEELDGIRGIAISAVFLFHLGPMIRERIDSQIDRFIVGMFDLGWAGVDLFFVLSGFLITSILLETKQTQGYFKNFYARRILRIFPIYYFSLIAVAIVFLRFPTIREKYSDLYDSQGWYWLYLQNWMQATNLQFHPSLFGHFWSLAIEEQFYLFWPFLVWLLDRPTLRMVCCGLIGLSFLLRMILGGIDFSPEVQKFLYFSTITRLDCLAIGSVAATFLLGKTFASQQLRRWSISLGVPSLVVLTFLIIRGPLTVENNWPMTTFGLTFTAAAALALLLYGLAGSRFLRFEPLKTIGKYSYALYIFHWPVIVISYYFLIHAKIDDAFFIPIYVLLTISVSFLFAFLSWHAIEKRFLALKSRFESKKHPTDLHETAV